MATLTFPSITPEIQTFGIMYNTQVSNSDISGVTQTVEMPGARWRGSISFSDMTSVDSAALKVFLLELRGSSGRFYYSDISHTSPFNPVTGTLTIAAASTARFVRITYADTNYLSPGDYVQIGDDTSRELKMVISNTQFSGLTYDVVLEPMIRRTDYVGKELVYTNPKGTFLLSSSDQATWGIRSKALLSDIDVDFIEVFV